MKKIPTWIAPLAVACLLALLAGWLYSRQAEFRLASIEVENDDPQVQLKIRARLTGYLGRGMGLVPLESLEAAVREVVPAKSVWVRRRWPDGVVIGVVIRTPIAMGFRDKRLWTLDDEGEWIEPLSAPLSLPLLMGFDEKKDEARRELCKWLATPRTEGGVSAGPLDLARLDRVEWTNERGFLFTFFGPDLQLETGPRPLDAAWKAAQSAAKAVAAKGLDAIHLDAGYRQRVVVQIRTSLQIPQNGLNFKDISRRDGSLTGAPATR